MVKFLAKAAFAGNFKKAEANVERHLRCQGDDRLREGSYYCNIRGAATGKDEVDKEFHRGYAEFHEVENSVDHA